MPFTFAHPAIVLNQKNNRHFDFTALIIGTMSPDFEYFINFRPISIVGHTLLGQFYFNLPLILLIAFLYHRILKTAIIDNLPKVLNIRYNYLTKTHWEIKSFKHLWIITYSAIFGAFTHIFWDSFTHKHGFFVDRISLLSSKFSFANYNLPVYKVLQHGSTIIGFLLIFVFLIRIMDRDYENISLDSNSTFSAYKDKVNVTSKVKFCLLSLAIASLIFFSVIMSMEKIYIASIIISFINSFLIALFFASIIYKFK